ncbi:hypothetical protein PITCH_A270002 [uncultured Desulfobacterium sp.]|uniref:Uncharacterized protein n=1 Tax=uncultured Desulfobacterium sp. TaxID=201089 RepID=A0A445MYN7_9BACT|nr:hypothetical protein PITCH_A270002 [uncultured Desulfobacterium sp.]
MLNLGDGMILHDIYNTINELVFMLLSETVEKCSILCQIKKDENFNLLNMLHLFFCKFEINNKIVGQQVGFFKGLAVSLPIYRGERLKF